MEPNPTSADNSPAIYSVGHSNHSSEELIDLLTQHEVQVIADVRTQPFSRYSPQFNRDPLRESLKDHGIGYVFLGRELGGRPDGDHYYDHEGHVRYDRLSQSDLFLAGLERLIEGSKSQRVAMLCSEGDPASCHRHLLIARVLHDRGIEVTHIDTKGRLRSYSIVATETAIPKTLFDTEEELEQWRSPLSVLQSTQPDRSSDD